MKVSRKYKNYFVEIFDDSSFSQKTDSPTQYSKVYELEDDKDFESSAQHAIEIYDGDKQIANAIILASNGATSVTEDAILIHDDNLIVRCSNAIVSLTLPKLHLNWMTIADPMTCFCIYQYQDSYITHGELSICRIDKFGKIMWEFGGADIFLKLDGENCCKLADHSITIKDFGGTVYEIDYNGKLLVTHNSMERKKPWWAYW